MPERLPPAAPTMEQRRAKEDADLRESMKKYIPKDRGIEPLPPPKRPLQPIVKPLPQADPVTSDRSRQNFSELDRGTAASRSGQMLPTDRQVIQKAAENQAYQDKESRDQWALASQAASLLEKLQMAPVVAAQHLGVDAARNTMGDHAGESSGAAAGAAVGPYIAERVPMQQPEAGPVSVPRVYRPEGMFVKPENQ